MAQERELTMEEKLLQAVFGTGEDHFPKETPSDEQRAALMAAAYKVLAYRPREILKLRFGTQDGTCYTLEEVGRIFKINRERVRQIEAQAIRVLQNPARASQFHTLAAGMIPFLKTGTDQV